jgi:DNA replication protein DnaC
VCNIFNENTYLTSNRSPELWSALTDDPATTTAILDRLLHRSEIVKMDGESFRMKHKMNIFVNESVKM